jgi:hypothetical protein
MKGDHKKDCRSGSDSNIIGKILRFFISSTECLALQNNENLSESWSA